MKKILIAASMVVFLAALLPVHGLAQDWDFGDAPEDALAYPSLWRFGFFPTCLGGTAGVIQHMQFGAWFGPSIDIEPDGNAGLCPPPPYDQDECFMDGDAGLLIPPAYTIDQTPAVVPCPAGPGGPLGLTCQPAVWGVNVDIDVTSLILDGFVNVLMDWNQDGDWLDIPVCPPAGTPAPEHVLVDFPVPAGFSGPLSALTGPLPFLIGPNSGYVWTRFSITPFPVGQGWDGSGIFDDGESEDYLLLIDQGDEPTVFPEIPTECPELETFCPDDDPTVCFITECPDSDTFCPVEPTICPVVETECPVVDTFCPIYGDTYCPEAQTLCPKVETLCPEEFTLCPEDNPTVCPYLDTECFQQMTWCPIDTVCPQAPTVCYPGPTYCEVLTSCPEDPTWCPVIPPAITICPIEPTFCPDIPTSCFPMEPTACPYDFTNCPTEWTYCPNNPTYCPDEYTFCPLIETECAAVETECPVALTTCPIDPTSCPGTQTWCPETPTVCPTLATFCPNDPTVCEITQCPVATTLCPVSPTICPLIDSDGDGIDDCNDNCPRHPNGPLRGTCTENISGEFVISYTPPFCTVDGDCGGSKYCEMWQADNYPMPPNGSPNGLGDACDCEGNFNCDRSVDGLDVTPFLADLNKRTPISNPCSNADPCNGDFNCDYGVVGGDILKFIEDWNKRVAIGDPCFECDPLARWCNYP